MRGRACLLYAAAVVWAVMIGASVSLEVCNLVLLNGKASPDDKSLHGFYISELVILVGGLLIAPFAFALGPPWQKPTRWWSLLGGICSTFSFITVSAGPVLGTELLLMVQLVGILGTFFLIDIMAGEVRCQDWQKALGFAICLIGIGLDNTKAFEHTSTINASWIFHFLFVFISGIAYGLQAKFNGQLATDVGGTTRAVMIAACINIIFATPFLTYIYFGAHVPITLDMQLWPMWLVGGFQSAFYIGSMAFLPKLLGYTRCYLVVLASKLVCGSLVDAYGLSGKTVKFSAIGATSLILVFMGAGVFNLPSKKSEQEEQMIRDDDQLYGSQIEAKLSFALQQ